MFFAWLKNYMPRSLYWRAALILMVPFFVLQIVVSIVFIQRHFEDVTQQMTRNAAIDLTFVLRESVQRGVATVNADYVSLGIVLSEDASMPETDGRLWFDISGLTVAAQLREMYDVVRIDLSAPRSVQVWVRYQGRMIKATFDRTRTSARNPHQLLVLMVITGLVMIMISFIFLRNQLRPITRLARAAEDFGRGRIREYQPSGAIEVRSAGSAFLDMRNRIERHIEQRTLLLSGVSHDLRTPLTRLNLGLSMMEESSEVEDMRRDIDEMRQMLDAFLEFSRDGAGEEAELVDVIELISHAVGDAVRGGAKVTFSPPYGDPSARLRIGAVRRAVDNLLSNAARYGEHANVSVAILERAVRITVEDDGPGIPKNQRDLAVRPFSRLEPARNQNRGSGVGLGLSIAADTARAHGGTLRLSDSEALGGLKVDIVLSR